MHYFKKSLALGKKGEELINSYFEKWYDIEPVTLQEELQNGIDYIYTNKTTGKSSKVEIKIDQWALKTRNFFLETEIYRDNDTLSGLGWVAKSCADILLYYMFPSHIYVIDMPNLKVSYKELIKDAPKKKIKNKGFYGIGYLVQEELLSPYVMGIKEVALA